MIDRLENINKSYISLIKFNPLFKDRLDFIISESDNERICELTNKLLITLYN
jgi:hypothetical protein